MRSGSHNETFVVIEEEIASSVSLAHFSLRYYYTVHVHTLRCLFLIPLRLEPNQPPMMSGPVSSWSQSGVMREG